MKILHRTKGLVHDLIVTRKDRTITLWSAEGNRHTVLNSSVPYMPGLEYARNTLAALAFCPQAQSCLVLGLGGGSIPRMLLASRPQMRVEAVEIDPAVVDLAVRYFDLRTLPRFTVHLDDAADFLRHCSSQYGIIVIDTYIGDQFPNQCATREFIKDARRCLLDDGVLTINWLDEDSPERKDLVKRLESVIGPVWQLPGVKSDNVLYFAAPAATKRTDIVSAAGTVAAEIPFQNPLRILAQRLRHPHGL